MDKKKFVRKFGISAADEQIIAERVAEAEKKTNGEIALAIVKQSHNYSGIEFAMSLLFSFIFAVLFLFFCSPVDRLLSSWFWDYSPIHLVATFFLTTYVPMLVMFALLNISFFERIFISKVQRRYNTQRRALLHFFESGLYKTKDHSGILIFVSVLERQVFVYADEGIHAKVEAGTWNGICTKMVASLKKKQAGKGFAEAVDECGEILRKAFPATKNNPNELPDGLVILER